MVIEQACSPARVANHFRHACTQGAGLSSMLHLSLVAVVTFCLFVSVVKFDVAVGEINLLKHWTVKVN